jgi:DNA mismatch endonuclease (patch repair protein)
MADILTKEQRSYNMSMIKGGNTKPEIRLKSFLASKGLKGYKTGSKLPGKPDIVFPGYRLAVFVDGCFWHKCQRHFVIPQTNRKFWLDKINGNVKRDRLMNQKLRKAGYSVLRFYEHSIKRDLNRCYMKIYKAINKKGCKNGTI